MKAFFHPPKRDSVGAVVRRRSECAEADPHAGWGGIADEAERRYGTLLPRYTHFAFFSSYDLEYVALCISSYDC